MTFGSLKSPSSTANPWYPAYRVVSKQSLTAKEVILNTVVVIPTLLDVIKFHLVLYYAFGEINLYNFVRRLKKIFVNCINFFLIYIWS